MAVTSALSGNGISAVKAPHHAVSAWTFRSDRLTGIFSKLSAYAASPGHLYTGKICKVLTHERCQVHIRATYATPPNHHRSAVSAIMPCLGIFGQPPHCRLRRVPSLSMLIPSVAPKAEAVQRLRSPKRLLAFFLSLSSPRDDTLTNRASLFNENEARQRLS